MFTYVQSTGKMYFQGPGYTNLIGKGYSGYGDHKNKPESQCFKDLGPIPTGQWSIGNLEDFTTGGGQVIHNCLRLTPKPGTNACGRTRFWIHGGNAAGTSSEGCIVLTVAERQAIGKNPIKDLRVIASEAAETFET